MAGSTPNASGHWRVPGEFGNRIVVTRAQAVEAHPASMEIPDMSDFQIADHGTVISIRPLSEAARQWLDENVVAEPWQWIQGALCVEARFARDLLLEIEEAGFEISR
jgi:hypothetical protein